IFTLSAGQLERQRTILTQDRRPFSLHARWILPHVGKAADFGKAPKLFLAHCAKCNAPEAMTKGLFLRSRRDFPSKTGQHETIHQTDSWRGASRSLDRGDHDADLPDLH